ncbi:hypothetical protein B0H14DRAFT_2571438 [Mycena olivaceomarginata]|nr:hypothetical protein B0H14DRAFT_2571438 [Mycena olivaceomarginata]
MTTGSTIEASSFGTASQSATSPQQLRRPEHSPPRPPANLELLSQVVPVQLGDQTGAQSTISTPAVPTTVSASDSPASSTYTMGGSGAGESPTASVGSASGTLSASNCQGPSTMNIGGIDGPPSASFEGALWQCILHFPIQSIAVVCLRSVAKHIILDPLRLAARFPVLRWVSPSRQRASRRSDLRLRLQHQLHLNQ